MFFKYLYSDKGQDILFIGNQNNAIPLNETAYNSYCEMNLEMNSILETIDVLN